MSQNKPLISVIIPCYNHSHFLPRAIDSVLGQDYEHMEVIVVDDGSTDKTAEVAQSYNQVHYVYQSNSGLSAARNTGIAKSKGDYVVFLDADDWLLPGALATNARYLKENKEVAFVSGAYERVYANGFVEDKIVNIEKDHFQQLLKTNYIGMIAAVMFRRCILQEFNYDTSLAACEDYDLYLRIARKYPVIHHTNKIAAYYIHTLNMSSNIPLMLNSVTRVLKRQKSVLITQSEETTWREGQLIWRTYYCSEIYKNLQNGFIQTDWSVFKTLLLYKPKYLLKYYISKIFK